MDRSVRPGSTNAELYEPAWSPDGSRIVFVSEIDGFGGTDLFTMRADGTDVRKLVDRPGLELSPSWSPDGTTIVFAGSLPRQGSDVTWWFPERNIYAVPAVGGSVTQLTASGTDEDPIWSPQGDKIAFQSDRHMPPEQTAPDVYVMDADGEPEMRITNIGCLQCGVDWQPLPTDVPPPWQSRDVPTLGAGGTLPQASPMLTAAPRMILPKVAARFGRFAVVPRSFGWRHGGRLRVGLKASRARRVRLNIAPNKVVRDARRCRSRSNPCRVAHSLVRRLTPGLNAVPIAQIASRALRPGRYRLTAVAIDGSARAGTTFRVRSRR